MLNVTLFDRKGLFKVKAEQTIYTKCCNTNVKVFKVVSFSMFDESTGVSGTHLNTR